MAYIVIGMNLRPGIGIWYRYNFWCRWEIPDIGIGIGMNLRLGIGIWYWYRYEFWVSVSGIGLNFG